MPAGGDEAQPADRGEREAAQLGVESDAHPLAALAEIERPLGAAIAVVFEDQPLDAELDALGIIGAGGDMRAPAALVVDRHHASVLDLDQVEPGDEPEPLGGERDRARMEALVVAERLRLRQLARAAVDPAVGAAALDRVGRTRPTRPAPIRDRQGAGNTGTR